MSMLSPALAKAPPAWRLKAPVSVTGRESLCPLTMTPPPVTSHTGSQLVPRHRVLEKDPKSFSLPLNAHLFLPMSMRLSPTSSPELPTLQQPSSTLITANC